MPKILEAASVDQDRIALTLGWPDGSETLEVVSHHAALMLGFEAHIDDAE